MMYCRNCGAKMDDNATMCVKCGCMKYVGTSFCPHCGTRTTDAQVVCTSCGGKLHSVPSASQIKKTATTKGKKLLKNVCFVIGALGILGTVLNIVFGSTGTVPCAALGGLGIGFYIRLKNSM